MATTSKKTTKKKVSKKTTETAAKKVTKKTSSKKKTAKKTAAKKTTAKKGKASSPLHQARALLKGAFKNTDWQTNLDPKRAREAQEVISTNSVVINALISGPVNQYGVSPCPGFPKGRIVNLYGKEGSGKTTLALETTAEVIRQGGTVGYIDWEHEIVPSYALALGVPIGNDEQFMLCQPDTLEEGVAILYTMVSAGVDLVVLDSVGAGVPKAYFDKAIKDTAESARLGLNAAVWSQFLPKLKARINKTRSTVIGISQIRDAINTMGYGDNFTVQGGKAWKFYSALRMRLQPIGQEKASEYSAVVNKSADRVVGSRIKVKLDKCKVSPQQNNETVFYIRYGEGIDDLRSLIEIGIAHKLIKKSSSWFEWVDPDGNSIRYQGMEKFRRAFADDEKLHRILEKQVLPYLGAASSTSEDEDEDDDLFGNESFQDDAELTEILSSINTTTED